MPRQVRFGHGGSDGVRRSRATDPVDDDPVTLDGLITFATTAQRLGFTTLTANDHLVYGRPWLDGPTALAAVMAAAPTVRLMTSVSLPVVRGPFALAKSLAAIDRLSGGRLDAGLGPGSSQADYALAGVPFDERWVRFDEAVSAMRASWDVDGAPFVGRFYDTTGVTMAPPPAQPKGPPIWIGSGDPTQGSVGWPAGRWLARLGLQHDAGGFREDQKCPRRDVGSGGSRRVGVPIHPGDVLDVPHRRPGEGPRGCHAAEPDAASFGRGGRVPPPGRLGRPMRRSLRANQAAGLQRVLLGPSATNWNRSSGSHRTSSHRSALGTDREAARPEPSERLSTVVHPTLSEAGPARFTGTGGESAGSVWKAGQEAES